MRDFGEMWDKMLEESQRSHEERSRQFNKLAHDQPASPPNVGARVLMCASLLCMGFEWDRIEGKVIETADTACLVRIDRDYVLGPKTIDRWVHYVVITDVLGQNHDEEAGD